MEPVCAFLLTPGRPLDAAGRLDLRRRLGALADMAGRPRSLACVGRDAADLKDLAAPCGLSVVVLEPGPATVGAAPFPWPRGAAEALAAAQERFPGIPCVLADALRTDLQPKLLQAFLAAAAQSPDNPMIALQPLRDHPCQLLHYFTLEDMFALSRVRDGEPATTAGILAAGEGENGSRWQWELAQGGHSTLSRLPCPWPRPTEARRETLLHVEILDVDGNSLGRVMAPVPPPGRALALGPLEEAAQSLLLCLFQAAHPGIDGLWRIADNGDIILEQTGRLLTGRQDFPPLYLPDGLLAYLPAKTDLSADAGLRGFPLDREPLPRLDEGSALERLLVQTLTAILTHDVCWRRAPGRPALGSRNRNSAHGQSAAARGHPGRNVARGRSAPRPFFHAPQPHRDAPPGRALLVRGQRCRSQPGKPAVVSGCCLAARPEATLSVCGTVNHRIKKTFPNVTMHGRVEDLEPQYAEAAVCIAPRLVGSGLEIKLVEAMGHGKCCVVNERGLSALPPECRDAVMPATDAEGFAATVMRALGDEDLRRAIGRQALDCVRCFFNPERAYGPLIDRIRRQATVSATSCDASVR